MAYMVKFSERLQPSAAGTETKALLYLMNFREDSEENYYYILHMENDNKLFKYAERVRILL